MYTSRSRSLSRSGAHNSPIRTYTSFQYSCGRPHMTPHQPTMNDLHKLRPHPAIIAVIHYVDTRRERRTSIMLPAISMTHSPYLNQTAYKQLYRIELSIAVPLAYTCVWVGFPTNSILYCLYTSLFPILEQYSTSTSN